MEDNNNNSIKPSGDKPEWIGAMQVFSEISTWIAVPIIIAVIVGKYLDNHYNTGHILLLVSAGLAFIISAYGIVQSVKKYADKIKKDKKQ